MTIRTFVAVLGIYGLAGLFGFIVTRLPIFETRDGSFYIAGAAMGIAIMVARDVQASGLKAPKSPARTNPDFKTDFKTASGAWEKTL